MAIQFFVGPNQDLRSVQYEGLSVVENAVKHGAEETARNILSYKLQSWSYEKEVRVFTHKKFVPIEIVSIFLGSQMAPETNKLIRKLVKQIDPNITVAEVALNSFS